MINLIYYNLLTLGFSTNDTVIYLNRISVTNYLISNFSSYYKCCTLSKYTTLKYFKTSNFKGYHSSKDVIISPIFLIGRTYLMNSSIILDLVDPIFSNNLTTSWINSISMGTSINPWLSYFDFFLGVSKNVLSTPLMCYSILFKYYPVIIYPSSLANDDSDFYYLKKLTINSLFWTTSFYLTLNNT